MSPIALLYFLLASPIFSEHMYRRHELPTFDRTSDLVERLFRTSPFEFESTFDFHPFAVSSSRLFNKFHGRRSILSELYPTSSVESSLFEHPFEHSFEHSYEHEPSMLHHVIRRNIEVIRRLAEVRPEMVTLAIEKLVRPESRYFVESILRHVEPESMLFAEKLIRKNLPVYLREKIVRRFAKELLTRSPLSHRSILSEMYPIEESSIFSTPYSTLFENVEPMMFEKLIRHTEVPEVLLTKVVRRMLKNKVVSPIELIQLVKLIKKSSSPRHFNTEESLLTSVLPIRRLVEKVLRRHSAYPTTQSHMIRKVMKALRTSTPFYPVEEETRHICHVCENVCSFRTSHMCSICDEVCSRRSFNDETPLSFFGKKHSEEKLIKKLIKKLSKESKEERMFF